MVLGLTLTHFDFQRKDNEITPVRGAVISFLNLIIALHGLRYCTVLIAFRRCSCFDRRVMLLFTVHMYPGIYQTVCRRYSRWKLPEVQREHLLRVGNLHEFHMQNPYLAWRQEIPRLTAGLGEYICMSISCLGAGLRSGCKNGHIFSPARDKKFPCLKLENAGP